MYSDLGGKSLISTFHSGHFECTQVWWVQPPFTIPSKGGWGWGEILCPSQQGPKQVFRHCWRPKSVVAHCSSPQLK